MKTDINQIIKKSQEVCESAGIKLTEKRKNVLVVLLNSTTPLSAYEIADKYRERFHESLPVMSVYRMLDFLIQGELVHKLESTGQYISCTHITCNHEHEIPQFLICDRCHTVKEIGIKKQLMVELIHSIQATGFTLSNQQLELHGLCEHCQSSHQ